VETEADRERSERTGVAWRMRLLERGEVERGMKLFC